MKRLIVRPEAEADISDAFGWYETQLPGLGGEFLLELEKILELIAERPLLFAEVNGPVRRAVTKRFPIGVFYISDSEAISILSVLHLARDPSAWPHA
ncbi:type II toxin-antitoxin system RelE/ParE family toxin [soil metagenome]